MLTKGEREKLIQKGDTYYLQTTRESLFYTSK